MYDWILQKRLIDDDAADSNKMERDSVVAQSSESQSNDKRETDSDVKQVERDAAAETVAKDDAKRHLRRHDTGDELDDKKVAKRCVAGDKNCKRRRRLRRRRDVANQRQQQQQLQQRREVAFVLFFIFIFAFLSRIKIIK